MTDLKTSITAKLLGIIGILLAGLLILLIYYLEFIMMIQVNLEGKMLTQQSSILLIIIVAAFEIYFVLYYVQRITTSVSIDSESITVNKIFGLIKHSFKWDKINNLTLTLIQNPPSIVLFNVSGTLYYSMIDFKVELSDKNYLCKIAPLNFNLVEQFAENVNILTKAEKNLTTDKNKRKGKIYTWKWESYNKDFF